MNFPLFAVITKSNVNFPTATQLKIDGNAGGIPNSFAGALFSDDDGGEPTVLLNQFNEPMTPEQWTAWTNQGDANYILQCTADNLGVTIKLSAAAKPGRAAVVKKKRK